MNVRAKFRVESVTDYGQSKSVTLKAVCPEPGEIGENERYHRFTPFGELKMTIDNPSAAAAFTPGADFYLNFVPCREPAEAP